jgi:hypothetical protein
MKIEICQIDDEPSKDNVSPKSPEPQMTTRKEVLCLLGRKSNVEDDLVTLQAQQPSEFIFLQAQNKRTLDCRYLHAQSSRWIYIEANGFL